MKEVRADARQLENEEEQVNKSQETGAQPKNNKRLPGHPSIILVMGG
jgi:hypothetical protein